LERPLVVSSVRLSDEAARILREVSDLVMPESGAAGREWLVENARGATVLIVGFLRVNGEIYDAAGPSLRLVLARSSGVDHIDLQAAIDRGICVANQPEAIAMSVAEHAVGIALTQTKRLLEGHMLNLEGGWNGFPRGLRGFLLRGITAGIVGLGRIGVLIAGLLRSLGVGRILYWSRRRKPELELLLRLEPASLERLFSESRLVFVTLPLTRDTRGLIDYRLLSRLPSGAVFVNVGRGPVVREGDLVRVLKERSDLRVALDVYEVEPLPQDSPLRKYAREGRVTLTPHFAGYSEQSMLFTDVLVAKQARHFLARGEVWNPVTPNCVQARDIPGLWAGIP